MYIERVVPYPNLASYLPLEASAQAFGGEGFDSQMKILQSRAEIIDRLQGVPMSTVSIAPNVLEKMADDSNVRAAVLKDVDTYVNNYKQYNIPGVVTMSFSIDANGVPCIHGVNEVLKAMCDEGKTKGCSGAGQLDTALFPDAAGQAVFDADSCCALAFSWFYQKQYAAL